MLKRSSTAFRRHLLSFISVAINSYGVVFLGLLCVGERSGFLELPASGDIHGCVHVNEVKDGNPNYATEGQMKFNHLFGGTVTAFFGHTSVS